MITARLRILITIHNDSVSRADKTIQSYFLYRSSVPGFSGRSKGMYTRIIG